MDFNNLDHEAKKFIASIVDNYVLGKKYMKDGSNPYISTPGVQVQNIFIDISNKYVFNINLHKYEDSNIEVYYVFDPKQIVKVKNEDEYDAEERFIKIKRAEFIYKISLLKWLLDSGCIFLVDDKSWNIFNTGQISEHDKSRWESHGIKYYREVIKSKTLFDFISEFHNCIIIPSPQLIDLRNNKFKTPERIRFIRTQIVSWTAIVAALVIATLTPFLSNLFSHSTIEQSQFDTIINAMPRHIDNVRINKQQMDSIITILNKRAEANHGKTKNAKQ